MIGDLLVWYTESFVAFWRGMFGGGVFQLVLIGFLIWWFFCRRRHGCCCPHCGCWCGRCRCEEVRLDDDEKGQDTAEG